MRLLVAAAAFVVAIPAIAQDKPAAAEVKADPGKVVCKREVETGSLVRARKTCMTKREWSQQAASAQDEMTRTVGSGSLNQN